MALSWDTLIEVVVSRELDGDRPAWDNLSHQATVCAISSRVFQLAPLQ
jgi:hypothetical protein